MPSLCRTRRFLRRPASFRSPSMIMSSTPFTEVGCMGRIPLSVFLLNLCSCGYITEEVTLLWEVHCTFKELTDTNRSRVLYLSFIIDQLKLPSVCQLDLRPDRHPRTRVHPHIITLVLGNRGCSKADHVIIMNVRQHLQRCSFIPCSSAPWWQHGSIL